MLSLLVDFDERCDRNLIELMPTAMANARSPLGKQAGLMTLLYFSRWPNETSASAKSASREPDITA